MRAPVREDARTDDHRGCVDQQYRHSSLGRRRRRRVLDTTFKGKHVFTAWGLRGPELTRSGPGCDRGRTQGAARGCRPQRRAAQPGSVHRQPVGGGDHGLSPAYRSAPGDAIFFLCDSQAVVEWLITALEVQGAD